MKINKQKIWVFVSFVLLVALLISIFSKDNQTEINEGGEQVVIDAIDWINENILVEANEQRLKRLSLGADLRKNDEQQIVVSEKHSAIISQITEKHGEATAALKAKEDAQLAAVEAAKAEEKAN